MACAFCGKPVNPHDSTVYQRVSGWEHRRKGGGTNAIALRKVEQKWAHANCIRRASRGLSGQESLV